MLRRAVPFAGLCELLALDRVAAQVEAARARELAAERDDLPILRDVRLRAAVAIVRDPERLAPRRCRAEAVLGARDEELRLLRGSAQSQYRSHSFFGSTVQPA